LALEELREKRLRNSAENQWLVLAMYRTDQWLAVARAIREDRRNVQRLTMEMVAETDVEAVGLAFANALRTNTTLRYLSLSLGPLSVANNKAFIRAAQQYQCRREIKR
jgi:hypothetical protein